MIEITIKQISPKIHSEEDYGQDKTMPGKTDIQVDEQNVNEMDFPENPN